MNKLMFLLAALLAAAIAGTGIIRADPVAPPPEAGAPVRVLLPAARDVNAPGGLPLRRLMDIPMRDPNVTRGPDGAYYLVGTTDPAPGYTQIGANFGRWSTARAAPLMAAGKRKRQSGGDAPVRA